MGAPVQCLLSDRNGISRGWLEGADMEQPRGRGHQVETATMTKLRPRHVVLGRCRSLSDEGVDAALGELR